MSLCWVLWCPCKCLIKIFLPAKDLVRGSTWVLTGFSSWINLLMVALTLLGVVGTLTSRDLYLDMSLGLALCQPDWKTQMFIINSGLNQGIFAKGEGSVQLTSLHWRHSWRSLSRAFLLQTTFTKLHFSHNLQMGPITYCFCFTQGLKGISWTNTLAYWAHYWVTMKMKSAF